MASIPAENRAQSLKNHISSSSSSSSPPSSASGLSTLRPVITSVNGDVSWIISCPRPTQQGSGSEDHDSASRRAEKSFYHILVDPWFGEPATVLSNYLLGMALAADPVLRDRSAVETAIQEIEDAVSLSSRHGEAKGQGRSDDNEESLVDAILVTGGVEHCSKASLVQFSPSTPVFSTNVSYSNILSWKHFDTVVKLELFDTPDPSTAAADAGGKMGKPWTSAHPGAPLPEWLNVFQFKTSAINNFALGLISHDTIHGDGEGDVIILAPHGVYSSETSVTNLLKTIRPQHQQQSSTPTRTPTLRFLAYLAPFKQAFSAGIASVCGVSEGLALAQYTASSAEQSGKDRGGLRYYVHNGDLASLKYSGALSYVLRDEPRSMEWGVEQLRLGNAADKVVYEAEGEREGVAGKLQIPREVKVENGTSYVLV